MRNLYLFAIFLFLSCKSKQSLIAQTVEESLLKNEISNKFIELNSKINDSSFVNLNDYSNDFVYDMKYATTDNFLKAKVYDCEECFLRLKTVKALINANNSFMKLGFKIKLFDCYRPLDVQKKMWEIVPNPVYV
ncbi:M15 family metallopeptidase, partial [Flavobacterium sp.]|uniref:M15 family metallopeptidase n=1 Tax=Flavobacterium sp. TaxID=239 RepID=UPI00286E69D4